MINCPICKASSAVVSKKTYPEYNTLYCETCHLQYSDPMRDPGVEFYRNCGLYNGRMSDGKLYSVGSDWRFACCLNLIELEQGKKILDIGCGDGGFLALAHDRGLETFGIDLDPRGIALAREKRGLSNLHCGTWTDLAVVDEWKDFDVITLFDVLEHVSDPLSLVCQMHSALRPGGQICLTVPRLDRYPQMFDLEADVPPHHLTLWTKVALISILEKAGFENIRLVEKPLSSEDFLALFLWQIKRNLGRNDRHKDQNDNHKTKTPGIRFSRSKRLIRLFFKSLFSIPTLFLRITGKGRGCTLMALAKKRRQGGD